VLLRTAAAIIIINLTGNRISKVQCSVKCTTAIMSSSKHPEEEEQEVAEEEEAEAKIEIEVRTVLMAVGRPIITKINILITKTTSGICQRIEVEEDGKSIKARPQLAKPMLSRRAPHKSTIFRKRIRTKKQKQGLHSQTSLNTRSTRPFLI
jgi:hypothetical protein